MLGYTNPFSKTLYIPMNLKLLTLVMFPLWPYVKSEITKLVKLFYIFSFDLTIVTSLTCNKNQLKGDIRNINYFWFWAWVFSPFSVYICLSFLLFCMRDSCSIRKKERHINRECTVFSIFGWDRSRIQGKYHILQYPYSTDQWRDVKLKDKITFVNSFLRIPKVDMKL